MDITEFIGQIIKTIIICKEDNDRGDTIEFRLANGKNYRMMHEQNCCESVIIEDICGNLDDLMNEPVVQAFEKTNSENPKKGDDENWTWTFYTISTLKGTITIRWYGTSNGYYSERVSINEINNNEHTKIYKIWPYTIPI